MWPPTFAAAAAAAAYISTSWPHIYTRRYYMQIQNGKWCRQRPAKGRRERVLMPLVAPIVNFTAANYVSPSFVHRIFIDTFSPFLYIYIYFFFEFYGGLRVSPSKKKHTQQQGPLYSLQPTGCCCCPTNPKILISVHVSCKQ